MPGHSRSRDRQEPRDRTRERDHERERRREHQREREYIRGRYEEDDQGGASSPSQARGKYRFRGEEGYESYDTGDAGGSDYDERRRRERRERRRQREREEERAYSDAVEERRRDRERSKARESPATSPVKKRDRERDRDGQRRRRGIEDEERHRRDVRERRHREKERESELERERLRNLEAEARRQRRKAREREERRDREWEREAAAAAAVAAKHQSTESTGSASHLLSADPTTRLISEHEDDEPPESSRDDEELRRERRRQKKKKAALLGAGAVAAGDLGQRVKEGGSRHRSGARVVSGAYLEEGRAHDMKMRHRGGGGRAVENDWKHEQSWDGSDGDGSQAPKWKFWASWSKKKRLIVGAIVLGLLVLAIAIPIAVSQSKSGDDGGSDSSKSSPDSGSPSNSNLNGVNPDSIPSYAQGTVLDPFTWYDTVGFNVTFTNETVGGLSIMGLNSSWDDSARANSHVPPLNKKFPYGTQPIRGVNLGGWLSLEPFITPSMFKGYSSNVIDEWTLTQQLGSAAASTLEKHYATFITESDIAEIKDAGLDHVRIPYSYWAVTTYEGDPYVAQISWRYLLRTIEYCRKYGIRVKLDLHGVPGSQNGWNHSGHQGRIGWLMGSDGDLNRKRSLEVHDQLSRFFAQDRYKNVVTMYGLANEPLMLNIPVEKVLNWTQEAAEMVRKNGVEATIIFHDGFLNLDKWSNMFKNGPDNMYLDTHQYTIFNTGEIVLNHTAKIDTICKSWYPMIQRVNSASEGWGPTICGEWSQADTDCAEYLNNVGRGTRWEGTYDTSSSTVYCPTADQKSCSCTKANADPTTYSDAYKKWLQTYAEAQMSAFETAQGWMYWTWRTETAAQWSYRTAWKNGYMPNKAYSPSFKCGDTVPDFDALGLAEYYR
ncbi:putative glucan 1,3-beta-glucosidase D [Penicillium oxalicum]|uniref:putative glucan 1,3-beta-glucosidase D n=1 Tax=Penicillium oxalicum TaxID=69781 RepID=UPI0020B870C9|nr:putative glucan 1,3-beta-glucosidase D [Penicillium oxalicum]KAI2794630.1 putative glucan 1,3-beta-glucosidase D [Penicillium oxalicum]